MVGFVDNTVPYHWEQFQRGPSPWPDINWDAVTPELIGRFWAKVEIVGPDDCWPWQGAMSSFGHGRFKIGGRLVSPHRFIYELLNGILRPPLIVLHNCDNPPCCNPRHLRSGTKRDNMQDALKRGRIGGRAPGL